MKEQEKRQMRKQEKIIILILIGIIIIALGVLFLRKNNEEKRTNKGGEMSSPIQEEQFYQELEDGIKLNTSTKLKETKTVNGLQIRNIQLTNQNNQTVLLAEVENTTGNETGETVIDVTILNKEGKELGTIGGMIAPLKAGEKTQLNISAMKDYVNASDFRVTVK